MYTMCLLATALCFMQYMHSDSVWFLVLCIFLALVSLGLESQKTHKVTAMYRYTFEDGYCRYTSALLDQDLKKVEQVHGALISVKRVGDIYV